MYVCMCMILLHTENLIIYVNDTDTLYFYQQTKTVETFDLGQKLVELGFAKTSVPRNLQKKSIESQLAPALLSAEARAKSYRNGIWSDLLPPIPWYIVYWRKGSKVANDVIIYTSKKLFILIAFISKSALVATKNLMLRPFRKSVQPT